MAETFDLAAARARCESATPGPWRWLLPERENDDAVMVGTGSGDSLVLTTCVMPQERDLAFIAHARTDLPAALDEIERLRAEREAVDRLVEAVREMLWLVDDGAPEKETVHWRIRAVEAARAKSEAR